MMTAWSVPALVLLGILLGPYGLDLLTRPVLQLVDPMVAMALAMVGACVGLEALVRPATQRLAVSIASVMFVASGLTMIVMRNPSAAAIAVGAAAAGAAAAVAMAGSLLVGQTDSEREQQVFVVGSLLLLGGAAVYLSLSALLAGFVAGLVWSSAGALARARIIKELDYFQHLLIVLLLVSVGASIVFKTELLIVAAVIGALRLVSQAPIGRFPLTLDLIAVALAFDFIRGVQR